MTHRKVNKACFDKNDWLYLSAAGALVLTSFLESILTVDSMKKLVRKGLRRYRGGSACQNSSK